MCGQLAVEYSYCEMFGSFTWLNILLGFGFGAVIVSRSFRSQLSDLKLTVEIVLILN